MKTKLFTGLITILIFTFSTLSFGQQWLFFPTGIPKNWLNIGDLNVTGDSITVEALISLPDLSTNPAKNIVSKHTGVVNCNYLLRHWRFELTTTSGYTSITNPVSLCLDSIYHVAGTYDGDSMKYYVNGTAVASKHWAGNLIQNSFAAAIGNISEDVANEQFFGYIDEVRIWRIARSQTDIANNMYDLPNPTSQYGLLAYYKFEGNYNNVQGNPAYNGIPVGTQLKDTINPFFYGTVSNPPVDVSVTIIVSNNPACAGTLVNFIAMPQNGGNSPIFQWKVNGINVGTNNQTFTYSPLNGDIVTCILTSSIGCTLNNPATSNPITMIVNTSFTVSVSIIASFNPVCSGSSVTFSATPINGGTNPSYQWQVNSINSGTNSPTFLYNPLNGDVVKCILTSSLTTCVFNNPDTSNAINMVVNPNLPVSITINASQNPVCAGDTVTFTATPMNEGTSPNYQWKVNGVAVGTNDTTYTYVPLNTDIVSCELASSLTTCVSNNPATSNSITMIVNAFLHVNVTISSSVNPVCFGSSVSFTATPTNEGISPNYQWKINGTDVGTNTPIYTYTPVNGDIVACVLTSSITVCITNNPDTSNSITMVVNPLLPVSVSISSSANPVCTGTTVTYTAIPTNGGTNPTYQWNVNGNNVGINSPTYSYIPSNNDFVSCILTSSDTVCITNNPASSNFITMVVNPILPVSVSIQASSNPSCHDSSVTFTATLTNGGTTPVYQWKVNGANVGINSSTYTYTPVNNDIVSCIMTSSEPCTTNNPATSNTVIMTVYYNLPAGVIINVNPNPFCQGTSVTFGAMPVNGGTVPSYQWKVNGINAGSDSPSFIYSPQAGDSVWCLMTSNLFCVTGNPALSNKIVMVDLSIPVVTFTRCFDSLTTINAKPMKLKGGLPLGGIYSGPGVNSTSGVFTPSVAGTGTKTITYSYTNVYLCSASNTTTITVQSAPPFTCGNNLTDIRDGKAYRTIQVGSKCWMGANLNYGTWIHSSTYQRDNCIPEKYCPNDLPANCQFGTAVYQWDELIQYGITAPPDYQGVCPPGWHIPSAADFQELINANLGNSLAGTFLIDPYLIPRGFEALLQGMAYLNTSWAFTSSDTPKGSLFWTSTPGFSNKIITRGVNSRNQSVSMYESSKANAFSVRCLKD